jgi:hypothetical protein
MPVVEDFSDHLGSYESTCSGNENPHRTIRRKVFDFPLAGNGVTGGVKTVHFNI